MNKRQRYTVERLTSRTLLCGEGPVWHADAARLYYTDASDRAIYCYRPSLKRGSLHTRAVAATSLCLHAGGGLLTCGPEGLAQVMADGRVRRLQINVSDTIAVNRLNDIVADPRGRVFVGQNVFGSEEHRTGYLFRVDSHGAQVCAGGVLQGNGMDFGPDLRSFYFTDSILREVYRFEYDVATGHVKNRRVLVRFSRDEGLPDGLAVDAEGFIWIALFYGACLVRVDPDGDIERRIDLPIAQPTSLAFGGCNLDEIFVTSESTFTPGELVPARLDQRRRRGGQLFRIRQDIRGRLPYAAQI